MRNFYNILLRLADKMAAARQRAKVIGRRRIPGRHNITIADIATAAGVGLLFLCVLVISVKSAEAKDKAFDEQMKKDGITKQEWFAEVDNLIDQGWPIDNETIRAGYGLAAAVAADRREGAEADAKYIAERDARDKKHEEDMRAMWDEVWSIDAPTDALPPAPDKKKPAAPKGKATTGGSAGGDDDQELLDRILEQIREDAMDEYYYNVAWKFVNWVNAGRPELSDADGQAFADYCSYTGKGRFYSVPEAIELMYARYQDNLLKQKMQAEQAQTKRH